MKRCRDRTLVVGTYLYVCMRRHTAEKQVNTACLFKAIQVYKEDGESVVLC